MKIEGYSRIDRMIEEQRANLYEQALDEIKIVREELKSLQKRFTETEIANHNLRYMNHLLTEQVANLSMKVHRYESRPQRSTECHH